MKYRILIVDDEASGREALKILLEDTFHFYIEHLYTSSSFEEAQRSLSLNNYDLIFLDINLKGKSAFDLLHLIPSDSRVVFVSAYSEFILKALRSKVFDYLLKPIKLNELSDCLDRFIQEKSLNQNSQTISIKQHSIKRVIHLRDIIYIKGSGPYSSYYLHKEVISTSKTIKTLINELGPTFIRVHKSYLVNKLYIKGFNKEKIILHNETCLPVSRSGYKLLCA